ncbi:MAG: hypothetical protein R6X29_02545 [Acidimicrobiia bacterium]|jgi:hypothetical protein
MRTPLLAGSVVLALVLSACSGGSEPETGIPGSDDLASTTSTTVVETTTTVPASLEETALRFTACMREQGIEIPDIAIGPDGRPLLGDLTGELDPASPEFQDALAVCSPILTEAGALDLSADPELQAVIQDQLQAFAACMRDEGVSRFPDPTPGFTGVGSPFPLAELPLDDPAFEPALQVCQANLSFRAFGD